jgi:hypothetical protein
LANSTGKYGLRPFGPQKAGAILEFPVDPSTSAIYIGDAVIPVADEGVAQLTAGSAVAMGVAVGFKDSNGEPKAYYPAANATGYKCLVNIDYEQRYMIKCGTALTAADIGSNSDLEVGTGSTVTGLSGMFITTVESTAANMRILGLAAVGGNNWGANQDVVVVFNEHSIKGTAGV